MAADTHIEALPLRRRQWVPSPAAVAGVFFVGLFLAWLIVNAVKAPADFYNNFLIGLTNGAVYGLIAIGYSLVYGILELINFAHGDVFMLGGMMTATMVTALSLEAGRAWYVLWPGILLCLLVAVAFCGT